MTEHTPGPWSVDTYGDVQANGEDVARIAGHYGEATNAANAALIAEAPALLDALQELAGWQTTAPPSAVDAANAAIQRALGHNAGGKP